MTEGVREAGCTQTQQGALSGRPAPAAAASTPTRPAAKAAPPRVVQQPAPRAPPPAPACHSSMWASSNRPSAARPVVASPSSLAQKWAANGDSRRCLRAHGGGGGAGLSGVAAARRCSMQLHPSASSQGCRQPRQPRHRQRALPSALAQQHGLLTGRSPRSCGVGSLLRAPTCGAGCAPCGGAWRSRVAAQRPCATCTATEGAWPSGGWRLAVQGSAAPHNRHPSARLAGGRVPDFWQQVALVQQGGVVLQHLLLVPPAVGAAVVALGRGVAELVQEGVAARAHRRGKGKLAARPQPAGGPAAPAWRSSLLQLPDHHRNVIPVRGGADTPFRPPSDRTWVAEAQKQAGEGEKPRCECC